MKRPHFTLTVAVSVDALISPSTETPTHMWVSSEEQDLFFADVEAADWCIMGRHTHEAADRPDRRRIVFSTSRSGWQRPTQLWVNPKDMSPADLAGEVEHVRPLRSGLVLGGTRVHDWFLAHGAIDRVNLTVEPVRFGAGLPIFSDQQGSDPLEIFRSHGFVPREERALNERGTRYYVLASEFDR
ncbi:MAG: dihydrofolate reductase family protein [Silicimonas sp.]|nr:dihydrofolate reductase family protein [Silicimonas sp.]